MEKFIQDDNESGDSQIEEVIKQAEMYKSLNRPETTQGGRRRQQQQMYENSGKLLDEVFKLENEKKEEKVEEDEVVIIAAKGIDNDRPPCRKKQFQQGLEGIGQTFENEADEWSSKERVFQNQLEQIEIDRPQTQSQGRKNYERPPSRKIVATTKKCDIEDPFCNQLKLNDNANNDTFPIKNMFGNQNSQGQFLFDEQQSSVHMKKGFRSPEQQVDSFQGLDSINFDNKVNFSNFFHPQQQPMTGNKNIIPSLDNQQKFQLNQCNSTKNRPQSSQQNSNMYVSSSQLAQLPDNAMKNNFTVSKLDGSNILLKHNKRPLVQMSIQQNEISQKIAVPFESSLGEDFLSLFANNTNLKGEEDQIEIEQQESPSSSSEEIEDECDSEI